MFRFVPDEKHAAFASRPLALDGGGRLVNQRALATQQIPGQGALAAAGFGYRTRHFGAEAIDIGQQERHLAGQKIRRSFVARVIKHLGLRGATGQDGRSQRQRQATCSKKHFHAAAKMNGNALRRKLFGSCPNLKIPLSNAIESETFVANL
jgi:hypothetical protein